MTSNMAPFRGGDQDFVSNPIFYSKSLMSESQFSRCTIECCARESPGFLSSWNATELWWERLLLAFSGPLSMSPRTV